jgi:hypothetical protein
MRARKLKIGEMPSSVFKRKETERDADIALASMLFAKHGISFGYSLKESQVAEEVEIPQPVKEYGDIDMGWYIRHFIRTNANGDPIYYLTLKEETIEQWKNEQTPDQQKLSDWIKKIQTEEWEGIV